MLELIASKIVLAKVKKTSLLILFLVLSSCSKSEEEANCSELMQAASDASGAYVADQNSENCQAYIGVLEAMIDSGCATDPENTQSIIDSIQCPD